MADGHIEEPATEEFDSDVDRHRLVRWLAISAVVVFVAAGVVLKVGVEPLVALGNGIVRLVNEPWSRPAHKTVAAEPPKRLGRDPLADLPADLRSALISAELQADVPFRYQLWLEPSAICKTMAEHGLPNSGWKPIGDGPAHDCMSDLVPLAGSVPVRLARNPKSPDTPDTGGRPRAPRPSSLFFNARGSAKDRLDTIRFKLNLDDPSLDSAGRSLLIARLRDISGPLSWPLPDAVVRAIRDHKKLTMNVGGIIVEVHPEFGPVLRLNVVLVLRSPASRLPTDRFVQAPPVPPEMLPKEPDPRDPQQTKPRSPSP